MPQLSRHAATWMNEPATWDAFVALVKRRPHLETTATKPVVVGDIEVPFAKWARQARENEDALSDEQWAALDGVGFSWSGPAPSTVRRTVVRAPIAATTKPLVTQAILDEVATRIRNGRATVEDLQFAHRYNTNPAVDPIDFWLQRGLTLVRACDLTLISAAAAANTDSFALGAWGGELQRALAHGLLTAAHTRLPELRLARTRDYLRNLGLVRDHIRDHGTTDIPGAYIAHLADGRPFQLGEWLAKQREAARAGTLDADRRAALTQLKVRLSIRTPEVLWETGYAALVQYRKRRNPETIPQNHTETLNDTTSVNLDAWVRHQGTRYREGRMRDDQVRRLRAMGVDVEVSRDGAERFASKLAAFDQYRFRTQSVHVPDTHEEPFGGETVKLGSWVGEQRKRYKAGALEPDRIDALNARGFVWDALEQQFQEGLAFLAAYREQHGHAEVRQRETVDRPGQSPFPLGVWVNRRRQERTEGSLPQHRVAALDALGFSWNPHDERWRRSLAAYIAHVDATGDRVVARPATITIDDNAIDVHKWVNTQRARQSRNELSAERIRELENHGFVWDVRAYKYELLADAAPRAQRRFADGTIPRDHVEAVADGTAMTPGPWLTKQRSKARAGTLTDHQRATLHDRGIAVPATTRKPAIELSR